MDNTLYHLASEQNDPAAQYLLGRKFFTGTTVKKDINEAVKWFKLAAAQNHTKAQFQLGKMYLYGAEGLKINYVYALGYLRDAASNNYAEAQFELGNYYLMGKAEKVDYAKALIWYRAAADQQNVRAMVALGKILYEGKGGIDPRPDEAKHYLSLAAEYGDSAAIKALRKISKHTLSPVRNTASITDFHAKLNDAAAGFIPSQYEVGMAYLKGNGVDMDAELAAKWLRRAAVNDYSQAQYMLSHLYRDGVGVKKDHKRALEWLRIAASAGVNEAQKELQSMHLSKNTLDPFSGSDTVAEKSDETSFKPASANVSSDEDFRPPLSQSPAPNNPVAKLNPPAKPKSIQTLPPPVLTGRQPSVPSLDLQPTTAEDQFRLANRYLTGKKIDKDSQRAVYWLEQAAMQNHIEAQYQLGIIYKEGNGVTASAAKAKYWLSKASKAGYVKADLPLKDLSYINLSDSFTINPPKARSADSETKTSPPVSAVKISRHNDNSADTTLADQKKNTAAKSGMDIKQNTVNKAAASPDHPVADKSSVAGNTTGKNTGDLSNPQNAGMIVQLGTAQQNTIDPNDEVSWLIKTANSNNEEAQLKLAEMYFTGRGVQRDIVAATQWYRKAAALGNAEAQFKLGDLYKEGLGVEKNNATAIKWYRKAANQGNEQAKRRLGGCRIC